MITALSEEFFGYQYFTEVIDRGLAWWPEVPTGNYASREEAEQAGLRCASSCPSVRAVKIQRTLEFCAPVTRDREVGR